MANRKAIDDNMKRRNKLSIIEEILIEDWLNYSAVTGVCVADRPTHRKDAGHVKYFSSESVNFKIFYSYFLC